MKFDVYALKHGFKESHLHARLMYDSKYLSICLNQLVSPFIGNMVKLGPSQDNVNNYLILGYLSITEKKKKKKKNISFVPCCTLR
jgi:hypothetical protein